MQILQNQAERKTEYKAELEGNTTSYTRVKEELDLDNANVLEISEEL